MSAVLSRVINSDICVKLHTNCLVKMHYFIFVCIYVYLAQGHFGVIDLDGQVQFRKHGHPHFRQQRTAPHAKQVRAGEAQFYKKEKNIRKRR